MTQDIESKLTSAIHDARLTPIAKVIFASMILNSDGKKVKAGQRLLSDVVNLNRKTFRDATRLLESVGYLQVVGESLDRREYRMAVPRRKPDKEFIPHKPFDLVGLVHCPHCDEWIDMERAESVHTAEMDARIMEMVAPVSFPNADVMLPDEKAFWDAQPSGEFQFEEVG